MKLHRHDFLKEIKRTFPDIIAPLNQDNGLWYLEVYVFLNYVQKLVHIEDKKNVALAFAIVEKFLNKGSQKVTDALVRSFLENINLNNHEWSQLLLGSNSKLIFTNYNEHLNET